MPLRANSVIADELAPALAIAAHDLSELFGSKAGGFKIHLVKPGGKDRRKYGSLPLLCYQATLSGIFSSLIFFSHSKGPLWCTELPLESTATVTGMSFTSNS